VGAKRVSNVEILNFLKKSLGIIIKRLEEEGILTETTYTETTYSDHTFIPVLNVTDTGIALDLPAMLYKVKVVGDYPVFLNIDRPVDTEYKVVWPGSYYIIPRRGVKLYLKAPQGFTTMVEIEALS
jgi:hypothetical protein